MARTVARQEGRPRRHLRLRKTDLYLFSRCPSCVCQEAEETALEVAEAAAAKESQEDLGSPEPGVSLEVNGVLAARNLGALSLDSEL